MRVPIAGGSAVEVASKQAGAVGIAVDDAAIYWTNQSAGTVMKAAVTGGPPVMLASGGKQPLARSRRWTAHCRVLDGPYWPGTVMKVAK